MLRNGEVLSEKCAYVPLNVSEGRGGSPVAREEQSCLPGGGEAAALLEQEGEVVEQEAPEVISQQFMVGPARCKCAACDHCRKSFAIRKRKLLDEKLPSIEKPVLVSLTIDPELFDWDPAAALTYVKEKRVIAELVRSLYAEGILVNRDWCTPLEFQMGKRKGRGRPTEFPHWHLLLGLNPQWCEGKSDEEVRWKLMRRVYGRWSCFRPREAGPAPWDGRYPWECGKGARPAFGTVDVEVCQEARGGRRAFAKYITDYIAKGDKVPEWYLDWVGHGNVTLWQQSRGYWGKPEKGHPRRRSEPVAPSHEIFVPHSPECFCEKCRDGQGGDRVMVESDRRGRRHVRERLRACGDSANVYSVRTFDDGRQVWEFRGRLAATWRKVRGQFNLHEDKVVTLRPDEWRALVLGSHALPRGFVGAPNRLRYLLGADPDKRCSKANRPDEGLEERRSAGPCFGTGLRASLIAGVGKNRG